MLELECLNEDLRRLGRAKPGAHEYQRGDVAEFFQQPAYATLGLSPLVDKWPITVIWPAAGVALTSIRVADEEEEHEANLSSLGHLHHQGVDRAKDRVGVQR